MIDRLPEPPSAAAVRGTLIHAVLEDLFSLSAADRNVDAAMGLFEGHFQRLRVEDPPAAECLMEGLAADSADELTEAVLQPARPLLQTYFALEDPTRLTPHARELAVATVLPSGLNLRGFVDRVDRASDGRIRLVDYKTGRSPGAGFESKALFQMRFYALVWWRMTGEVPARLQLLYLRDGQVISYDPTDDELLATERKILAIRDAIGRAVEDGFSPSTSALCGYCSFHEYCPAQGGSEPPFPMDGLERA